ncbi:MAG: hypothetical protein QOI39_3444, partial [Mycobacterium sp.]|nr:hypothetical protein [Mycobacterium sp.]
MTHYGSTLRQFTAYGPSHWAT